MLGLVYNVIFGIFPTPHIPILLPWVAAFYRS